MFLFLNNHINLKPNSLKPTTINLSQEKKEIPILRFSLTSSIVYLFYLMVGIPASLYGSL